MSKKDKEITTVDENAVENVEQTKSPRVRKLTITPIVNENSLNLNVDIIDHGQINLDLEVGELPQHLLHQLVLRGITSFVHDRTGSIKDVAKLPESVASVFNSIKNGTIFEYTRVPNDTVILPKFVEAAMVRDGLDITDVVARQTALVIWNDMSEEDKKSMRSDKRLKNLVAIANGDAARKALEVTE